MSHHPKDNIRSRVDRSPVPTPCKTEPCLLGIDEAGRGPVLGPMVYGISYCPVKDNDRLCKMGFADSKTLNEEQREGLFADIEGASAFLGYSVHILAPQEISRGMLGRAKYNLNALSHDTAIGLIRHALEDGVNVTEVYVDTVGKAETYQEKLEKLFPNIAITVCPKADSKYPIVSAASICAKVTRDRVLQRWSFAEKSLEGASVEFGCGYPSDPKTQSWLRETCHPVFGFPGIVRFSWSTAVTLVDKNSVKVLWDDDESFDDTDALENGSSISDFFPSQSKVGPIRVRHRFFHHRSLHHTTDF